MLLRHETSLRRAQPDTAVALALADPTREAAQIVLLLRERLQRLELPAPVYALALRLDHAVSHAGREAALWREAGVAGGEDARALLDRLAARLGPGRVRRPMLVDDHRPERAMVLVPAVDVDGAAGAEDGSVGLAGAGGWSAEAGASTGSARTEDRVVWRTKGGVVWQSGGRVAWETGDGVVWQTGDGVAWQTGGRVARQTEDRVMVRPRSGPAPSPVRAEPVEAPAHREPAEALATSAPIATLAPREAAEAPPPRRFDSPDRSVTRAPVPGAVRPVWLLPEPRRLQTDPVYGRPLHQGAPLVLMTRAERIEAGWFDGELVSRDYHDAQARDHRRLWVFRERRGGEVRWYLHGVFG